MAQLSLSVSAGTTTANLTGLGYNDWAAWNNVGSFTPNERKSGGGSLISAAAFGGASALGTSAAPITVSWTDGNPTGSSTNTGAAVCLPLNTTGVGYEITFPASRATRVARVFCFVGDATARVTAIISDASTGNQVDSTTLAFGAGTTSGGDIQVTYSAASDSQTMTIRVEVLSSASGSGGIGVQAAAVNRTSPEITADPGDASAYEGQSASFTTAATTSGGTLHYQWKDDGSNVGSDSDTYSPTVAYADNGSAITVVVSDDNGSTTSSAATLTAILTARLGWFKA